MSDLDFSSLEDAADGTTTMVNVDSTHARSSYHEEEIAKQERDVYENAEGTDSADNIDPRRLFQTPSVDEIRWYYTHTLGNTIVEKPIVDAFKNGFEVENDSEGEITEILEEYTEVMKDAEIKARRDGPAAIFFQFSDDNDVHEEPENVTSFDGFQLFTLDRWTDSVDKEQVANGTDVDEDHIHVRDTGLVVRDDLSHSDHGELLGYAVKKNGGSDNTFVHASRCQHFVWNHNVDGSVDQYTVGQHEGDSVLLPILIPLKALTMANWALGQTLYRYSAPLYAITSPQGVGEDDFDKVDEQITNLNSASDVTLPPGWDIKTEGAEGELNPEPYIDKLIEQMCAGVEMTKSVLMGTQTGTVSGSATDIKNYFNLVQRYRNGRALEKMDEYLSIRNRYGLFENDGVYESYGPIKWGPLFKMDKVEKAEAMFRVVNATSNAINSYSLTPEEAREIISMQWATLDIDADLNALTDEEMDLLREINGGPAPNEEEEEPEGNPEVGQNGGGNPEGNTTDPTNPT